MDIIFSIDNGLMELIRYMIVLITAVIAIISFRADHKRRKRQATFDFYHAIYEKFIEQLKKINKAFPDENSVIPACDIEANSEISHAIRGYLSCMERFAVGIRKRIFDFHVFKRTVGAIHTIKLFDRFIGFIVDFRQKNDSPWAYEDLEHLVRRLKRVQERRKLWQSVMQITRKGNKAWKTQ